MTGARQRRPWPATPAAVMAIGLVLVSGCASTTASARSGPSVPASTTTPGQHGPPGAVGTTVPGSVADPLTAPIRPLAALAPPGITAPVVTAPGSTFLTPAQAAALPLAEIGNWTLIARTADDRYLLVGVGFHGCARPAALDVSTTVAAVTITARLRTAAPATICPAIAAIAHYVVDLGAPLGARSLLHPPAS